VECNKYGVFETFKEDVMHVFDAFQAVYKPIDLKRMGLRYVNEIKFSEGNPFDWSNFISDSLLCPLNSFPDNQKRIARSMTQTIFSRIDHLLRFSCGMFNKSEFPSPISRKEFILDYDCFTEEVTGGDIGKFLEIFHLDIQTMFENSIKDSLRTTMGALA